MKLLFLGTGSAFTIGAQNYHSNLLLESKGGRRLLIDCGSDARLSLHETGYCYNDITDVYISHLHADHCGGLEWLGFTNKFNSDGRKPNLYMHESIAEIIWDQFLSISMTTLSEKIATIDDYYHLIKIDSSMQFTWEGIQFTLIRTIHVNNGDQLKPSFGLMFKINNTKILFTSDTQYTPDILMPYYKEADLIFHDCETSNIVSGVHSHYKELVNLDADIKSKTWLYHYNSGELPDAKTDGFLGFVRKGTLFNKF